MFARNSAPSMNYKLATTVPFDALICPLDGEALQREETLWRCSTGHSFDIAREGYVNLLPVQNKRSRDPGDSKAMIAARRRFLNAGHYEPIAAAVARVVLGACATPSVLRCLDAGCGEGYYLRQVINAAGAPCALSVVGVDISKWAVQSAAKQCTHGTYLVASNVNLPIVSHSVDVLLCMFGFPVYEEFARVLKPGGRLVLVEAGVDHLRELREIIYPRVKESVATSRPEVPGFSLSDKHSIKYSLALDAQEAVADLLVMTPHLYRASAEGRDKAARLTRLELTVDACISTWRRDA